MSVIRAAIKHVRASASSTCHDKKGVTALEYGVIAAAIVVALSLVVPQAAAALSATWTTITAAL